MPALVVFLKSNSIITNVVGSKYDDVVTDEMASSGVGIFCHAGGSSCSWCFVSCLPERNEHNGNMARQSQNAWVRHISSPADYPHKCIHTTNSLCLIHTHTICTKSFHNYKASWLMVWQSLGSKYTAPSWKYLHENFASITSSCLYLIETLAEGFPNKVIQSLIGFLSLVWIQM